METILLRLCKIHDLNTISVMVQVKHPGVTVYPHWTTGDGVVECLSIHGDTFNEAFADAVQQIAEWRATYDHDERNEQGND